MAFSNFRHSSRNISNKASSSFISEEVMAHNDKIISGLKKGDLIKINRGKFYHWGVFTDDDYLVIHLVAEWKEADKIEICRCKEEETDGIRPEEMTEGSTVSSEGGCPECKLPYRADSKIFTQNIDDVAKESFLYKANDYDDKYKSLDGDEIVERARSQRGPSSYHWRRTNCEHFATWCRYDVPKSSQTWVKWKDPQEYIKALNSERKEDTKKRKSARKPYSRPAKVQNGAS